MKLNNDQNRFIAAIEEGRNVFLTGKAGSGKTYAVKALLERLRTEGKKFIVVAPTGIAATNVGGQTIHSLFQLTPFGVLTFEDCKYFRSAKREVLANAKTIVIDEVSMLRPDLLDAMHWTLIKNGLPGLDTKQIIFVGDMRQLRAPMDDNFRSVLLSKYPGVNFTHANIYRKLNVQEVVLEEIMRQNDLEFINNLNIIREGGRAPYFRQFVTATPNDGVILAPHNVTVERYNQAGLAAQPGELFTFKATMSGTAKPTDFTLEQEIHIKDGCKIMYLVNSDNNPLRNGTIGVFVVRDGKYFIKVGGVEYALQRVIVIKKEYVYNPVTDALELREIGSIAQYPIRLAYAITIHKSQGLTFDALTLDLSRPVFEEGQMYVALSRVKGPEGLKIIL